MDRPADPATPFREVYQHFLAVLKKLGRKDSTRAKYLYDFKRFERWLRETGRPPTLGSLMDADLLFTYRHHLEALPQQIRGSEQGVDRAEIQRWGGWSDIATVDIYVHHDTTRARRHGSCPAAVV